MSYGGASRPATNAPAIASLLEKALALETQRLSNSMELDTARSAGEPSVGEGPRPPPESVRSSESFEAMSGSGDKVRHLGGGRS